MTVTVTDNFTITVSTTVSAPPIPGSGNRPQVNGTVLSWSGPVGGGPSNGAYTPQSRTLTKATGGMTTTHDGQVIEGLFLTGSASLTSGVLTIAHNNVTVRQCAIQEQTVDQADKYTIFIKNGVTVPTVEDCYIDGNARNGNGNTSCISGDVGLGGPGVAQIFMRRNTCVRSEQAIRYVLGGPMLLPGSQYAIEITENDCELIGGQDADWVEIYPYGTKGRVNNILIQDNRFDGTDNAAGGADAAINMTTASGLPVGSIGPNILINRNYLTNWKTTHAIVADSSGGGSLAFSITNNGILVGYLDNISPIDGTHARNSGNYIMGTINSTSGSLYHGTGVI